MKELFIPERWRSKFEIKDLIEKNNELNLILVEKSKLVPSKLAGKDVVLNGYLPRVEVIDYPFRDKPMYISFIRRRWKEKGTSKSYYNDYEFHLEGMKTTHEFGAFLKELNREELAEFFNAWGNLRYIRQKDFQVVQRSFKWFWQR